MTIKEAGRESVLPKVIPERIREAREARGFSTDIFGEMVGVSRQAVAQYETGQIGPSAEVLSRIIAVTGQPPTFFVNPRRRKADSSSTPFWRSLKRMEQIERARITRRIEWAADVVDYIEEFIELPAVDLPDMQWNAEDSSDEDIEEIALRVRADWGLGYGPIHDLATILEGHGIILIREKVNCKDMDAVSRWQTGRPFILYSAEVNSQPRVNFNLAHELGHLILHGGMEVNSDNLPRLERQANRFAGALLMPRITFPKEVISTSVRYFETLKARWRVAIAAMIYRCKDLAILSETQVKYLWRQMNVLGIRQIEPLDDAFEVASPGILRASLEMLVSNKVQTRESIERSINLNAADIESLGGTNAGWLSADKVVAFTPRPFLRERRDTA